LKRTIWLASYPKSGNTWLRLLLANLDQEGPVDINDIPGQGIASSRAWFDNVTLFPSGLLTHDECEQLRPAVHSAIHSMRYLDENETPDAKLRFVKTHDGYTFTKSGEPLLAGSGGADGAVLIVRDPRDVAPSLANHNGTDIDAAIEYMAKAEISLCASRRTQPNQLRQRLLGWNGFIQSWLDQRDIPVHVVRYESLKEDTVGALRAVLEFTEVPSSDDAIQRAVRSADFDELQRQEASTGFREAPRRGTDTRFFRRGVSGAWKDELTPTQLATIECNHGPMMTSLGYPLIHAPQQECAK